MKKSDVVDEKENSSTQIGPGDQLQAARIKQGLSIEDVATRMHLSLGILESIEENNFDDITAPIFVKGYLRAYARLVSLDEDEMIQLYIGYYSNEDPPINTTSQMAPEISTQDARVKWTTYLVIFVLIALLSAWWWNKTQNKSETVSLDTEQSTSDLIMEPVIEPVAVQPEVESNNLAEVDNPTFAPVEIEPPEIESAQEEASNSIPETEVELVIVESNTTQTNAVEPEPIVSTADLEQADQSSQPASTREFDINRAAPTGSDLLDVIVIADTWADIKDANNHRLVYDLLRANLSLQIKGKAPFNAFFGNGHGVEIFINSESVDVASQTQDDNTARLKIGTN